MLKCAVKPFDAAMPSVFSVPFCVQCMHIHAHKMRVHGLCCHVLVISRLFSSLQTCLYIIQCMYFGLLHSCRATLQVVSQLGLHVTV